MIDLYTHRTDRWSTHDLCLSGQTDHWSTDDLCLSRQTDPWSSDDLQGLDHVAREPDDLNDLPHVSFVESIMFTVSVLHRSCTTYIP